ncbi:MAG: hypothetical protein LBS18_01320 [Clostridiales bacterium]|jgi:[citrate (pro-3S)-lyase] ligase|nr:hypothetical protein [Clostridiales bacterium]
MSQSRKKANKSKKSRNYKKPPTISQPVKQAAPLDFDTTEKIRAEQNLNNYLTLLSLVRTQIFLVVSTSDTPCGLAPAQLFTSFQQKLGARVYLGDKFRCPYIFVLDSGKVVYENIVHPSTGALSIDRKFGEYHIQARACSFLKLSVLGASISVNNTFSDSIGRGLNFAVFDKANGEVIDFVNFDTYCAEVPVRRASVLRNLLSKFTHYCKAIGVIYISVGNLSIPKEERLQTENERNILKYGILREAIAISKDVNASALGAFYHDQSDIADVLTAPKSYSNHNGVRRFEDYYGRRVTCIGGIRKTAGVPNAASRSIFMFGGCKIFGVGNADEDTVSSKLQELLNANGHLIRVYNYGFYQKRAGAASYEEIEKLLYSLPVKAGDIIVSDTYAENCGHIDLSKVIEELRGKGEKGPELFFDLHAHYTPAANTIIAHKIFENLIETGYFMTGDKIPAQTADALLPPRNVTNSGEPEYLRKYKSLLRALYSSVGKPQNCGAIVMNCNPFTNGHRYLIETCAKRVDYLFVFVVQEDKSYFKFDDRFDMVLGGISDIKHVIAIPSGQYVLSSLTFSEYFNKSALQDKKIDASQDIRIFAEEIAPILKIKIRFAGEEPLDAVTKQYNEAMSVLLPQYGIIFEEIRRIEQDGQVVSASRVRALLNDENWEKIALLVPPATLAHLRKQTPHS